MGFFDKLKRSLTKTRRGLGCFEGKVNADFFMELEERLVMADTGLDVTGLICERSKEALKSAHISDASLARPIVTEVVADLMRAEQPMALDGRPSVILLIGVNGAGKTTTAGKLARYYTENGKSVLLAAADTFRAAAIDQLCVWADRAGVPIVKGHEGGDSASVIFDAVSSAKAKGIDLVICDTAGRLHNKKNLMEELARMARVIGKACPGAPVETLLVLDAVTGQNAINQAAEFSRAAGVTGIVLTKLDGTAKGGSVIAVKEKLGIPVRFIGVGEGIDDLSVFVPDDFASALFGKEEEA